jgi:uncharacterized protein (TIGR03382 family)
MRWSLLGLLLGAVLYSPAEARACGGFFCNNSAPVNQAAERIVFARAADGTVTAIIQIQYTGPSERFAWLLPVAGSPEIGVSSNSAFATMQSLTNPTYSLITTIEGSCRDVRTGAPSAGAASDASLRDAGAGGPVGVVNQGSVGPYDFVVLSTDRTSPDRVGDAMTWLTDNGYDVTSANGELLRPYLESGLNLLAFRLTKADSAGSIRPVRLTFGNGLPAIPIRPTAVAATSDMGVMVFMLGSMRAVPVNYLSLELNDALIDWINPGPSYNAVVTAAANEAGGQGFVTEFAGSTAALSFGSSLGEAIFPSWMTSEWELISTTDWTLREAELLRQSLVLGQYDGFRDAIAETLPLPKGVGIDDFSSCPSCYFSTESDIAGFDPVAYVAALRRHVVTPLTETRALVDANPYMTRLYTTMSADEMTMDPMFDFNTDLGDYSNVHTAERTIECSPSVRFNEAPWRVWLPSGQLVRGRGPTWPFMPGDLPANARTLRVGTSGTGDVVTDNMLPIGNVLAAHNATVPGPSAIGRDESGCSAAGAGSGAAVLGFLLLGAVVVRRRR